MKIVYCTCNVSVLESLQELLNRLEVKNFQIIDRVLANSKLGDNRFDTAVWPGYNVAVFVQCQSNELAQELMSSIKEFNTNAFNHNELIMAVTWTADDFCID